MEFFFFDLLRFFSVDLDCVTLGQNHQISYLQGQTLKLLLDKSGGTRVCHILLTLPAIKMAANPKALQVC